MIIGSSAENNTALKRILCVLTDKRARLGNKGEHFNSGKNMISTIQVTMLRTGRKKKQVQKKHNIWNNAICGFPSPEGRHREELDRDRDRDRDDRARNRKGGMGEEGGGREDFFKGKSTH